MLRGSSKLAAEKVSASTALGSPSGQQSQDVNRGEVVFAFEGVGPSGGRVLAHQRAWEARVKWARRMAGGSM